MKIESLRVDNLAFEFSGKRVAEEIHFQIQPGITRVISSTGSGRSTMLRFLCGLHDAQEGEFYINDQNVSDFSFEEWAPFRAKIGYSFDYGGLINNRSLFDNLLLPLHYHGHLSYESAVERVKEHLALFDLKDQSSMRPSEVTGSQRKAACVARSFLLDPEVLLLDDPTVGLKRSLIPVLKSLIDKHMRKKNLNFLIYSSDDSQWNSLFDYREVDASPTSKAA